MNAFPPIMQLLFFILVLVWLVVLTLLNLKHIAFFNRLRRGKSEASLEESLKYLLTQQDDTSLQLQEMVKALEKVRIQNQSHYQKIGFVRFNPYADTGGNQSFCLCLLNDYNDGIVITSLHSREQTRIYAKEIQHEKIDVKDFSKEEAQSIKLAKSISKKR
jgi:hypothetical protein